MPEPIYYDESSTFSPEQIEFAMGRTILPTAYIATAHASDETNAYFQAPIMPVRQRTPDENSVMTGAGVSYTPTIRRLRPVARPGRYRVNSVEATPLDVEAAAESLRRTAAAMGESANAAAAGLDAWSREAVGAWGRPTFYRPVYTYRMPEGTPPQAPTAARQAEDRMHRAYSQAIPPQIMDYNMDGIDFGPIEARIAEHMARGESSIEARRQTFHERAAGEAFPNG